MHKRRCYRGAVRILRSSFVVLLVASALAACSSSSPSGPRSPATSAPAGLPGLQTDTLAAGRTWPPEYEHLRERLSKLGLPAVPSLTAAVHNHDLLEIYIHGERVVVPAEIGIDVDAGYLTSLHT